MATRIVRLMATRKRLWMLLVAAAALGVAPFAARTTRAVPVPDGILVSGYLETVAGEPAPDGPYNVRAVVYDAASAGAEVCNWLETGISAHRGNIRIGVGGRSGAGTCAGMADAIQSRDGLWVELSLQYGSGSFETMAPRISVGAAARVHHAEVTETLGGELASRQVPGGAVGFFESDCPAGWARADEFDGLFPRGSGTAGSIGGSASTGEAGSHTHSITSAGSHSHGGLSGVGNHSHGVNCWTGLGSGLICASWGAGQGCHAERTAGTHADSGAHGHDTSGAGEHTPHAVADGGAHAHDFMPPYREFIHCRKL